MNRGGGTTLYAAPEIVLTYRGSKYSDIWSLGIMLYKILYGKHPLERSEKYSVVIKNFSKNDIVIEYPTIHGFEDLIEICKKMLQPEKRIDWDELKKAIYAIIGLSLKTSIVVNIGKFISFAQSISKIVMGFVYYIQKNEKNIEKLGLTKEAEKLTHSCKLYVPIFYREV
jgi:serine/threonine protein kinase